MTWFYLNKWIIIFKSYFENYLIFYNLANDLLAIFGIFIESFLVKNNKMPKKFQGENSKAVAARERKAETKAAEKSKQEKAREDAYWQDDDKQAQKKQQRKVRERGRQ